MKIRVVRPAEFEELGRITVAAYRHLQGGEPLGVYEDQLRAVSARAADSVVLVAVGETGDLRGGVTYVPDSGRAMSEFSDSEAAGIRMLAVHPDHQGAGIGRALTEACIARARAEGRPRIVLHSTQVMVVARAMYARMGFVEAPELDVYVDERPDAKDGLRLIAFVLAL
jgi:ribosomal protein S18 acetylase RimI-like enzyme